MYKEPGSGVGNSSKGSESVLLRDSKTERYNKELKGQECPVEDSHEELGMQMDVLTCVWDSGLGSKSGSKLMGAMGLTLKLTLTAQPLLLLDPHHHHRQRPLLPFFFVALACRPKLEHAATVRQVRA
jgi:hypothetical protein